ncbi:hypothetical protein Pcinc_019133 [Petrolisthes cinctipes]|uniref:Uncharacterized protein n=1 Tax=Petrolisthes cinctipes TaxID=88211 RepID=A0AAE1KLL2_PETCI|nr:hypothetical protein Pcinc_019133 [Petrolisthes cinctipes]
MDKECGAELFSELKNIMEHLTHQIHNLIDQIENLQQSKAPQTIENTESVPVAKELDASSQSEKKDITGENYTSRIGMKLYRTPPKIREPSSSLQETSQAPPPSPHPVTTTAAPPANDNDIPIIRDWCRTESGGTSSQSVKPMHPLVPHMAWNLNWKAPEHKELGQDGVKRKAVISCVTNQ